MSTPTPDETLLGLLCLRPMHGYDLLRYFHDRSQLGVIWKVSTSQVYAVLKRLSEGGWIEGTELASPVAPERIVYVPTPLGRARLQAWLDEPDVSPSIRTVRVEFLSRLAIARALDWPMDALINAQRSACEAQLHALKLSRARAGSANERLALDLVIAQTSAVLGWIDESVSAFRSEKDWLSS